MKQWDPELKERAGTSLYGAMLDRIDKVGGKVAGLLWYQGESDSSVLEAQVYKQRLKTFIQSVRKDLNAPDLPFYCVQLGRQLIGNDSNPYGKDLVRNSQRTCMLEAKDCGLATAIDLEMSSSAHIDTAGYKRIGRRLANVALARKYSIDGIKTGPQPDRVVFDPCRPETITIIFSNVNRKLSANPRVLGFTLRSEDGNQMTNQILWAKLDPLEPNSIILRALTPVKEDNFLWYGWGWDPICNVVDELDMALPAFGPMRINN